MLIAKPLKPSVLHLRRTKKRVTNFDRVAEVTLAKAGAVEEVEAEILPVAGGSSLGAEEGDTAKNSRYLFSLSNFGQMPRLFMQ